MSNPALDVVTVTEEGRRSRRESSRLERYWDATVPEPARPTDESVGERQSTFSTFVLDTAVLLATRSPEEWGSLSDEASASLRIRWADLLVELPARRKKSRSGELRISTAALRWPILRSVSMTEPDEPRGPSPASDEQPDTPVLRILMRLDPWARGGVSSDDEAKPEDRDSLMHEDGSLPSKELRDFVAGGFDRTGPPRKLE